MENPAGGKSPRGGGSVKFLVIDDSPEIVDAVGLCLNLRWPEAQVLSAGEGESRVLLLQPPLRNRD